MPKIEQQVHGKFKVFSGTLGPGNTIDSIARDVEAWVHTAKVASKSIGIEYIESTGSIILSIGYRDDEAGYDVKLSSAELGHIDSLDAKGRAKIEKAMAAASAKVKNVICHELYVTD